MKSTQEGVDPVGSCVGQRGVRVQKVIEELNNEKIDIIPHSEDMNVFLKGALAPAENLLIEVDEEAKTAIVTAPDDQLSLVIGRGGQNVRLAAKLSEYQITIKSAEGKVETKATGAEEYEIDTFKGITPEARDILIQHKLTTLNDLVRFEEKWMAMEDLEDDQKEILGKRVAQDKKDQEARDKARAAIAADFKKEAAEIAAEDKQE